MQKPKTPLIKHSHLKYTSYFGFWPAIQTLILLHLATSQGITDSFFVGVCLFTLACCIACGYMHSRNIKYIQEMFDLSEELHETTMRGYDEMRAIRDVLILKELLKPENIDNG